MLLRLPKIGMEMTEALLSAWLVADGATVATGQPLYTLETEKVEHEVEAPVAGVVRHLVAGGTTCAVGEPVAEIVES